LARHAVPALVAVTLCLALAGGAVALRTFVQSTHPDLADGRVATSFGPMWVTSFQQVSIPRTNSKTDSGMPFMGAPDKLALEVVVRLSNTTAAPVELTPARFGLRLAPGDQPIPVRGAAFESVRLLPGAVYDARVQFPVKGGEHQLSLLFDDPDGSGPISIDLGKARIQDTGAKGHAGH
jgi:hypothetical protein